MRHTPGRFQALLEGPLERFWAGLGALGQVYYKVGHYAPYSQALLAALGRSQGRSWAFLGAPGGRRLTHLADSLVRQTPG